MKSRRAFRGCRNLVDYLGLIMVAKTESFMYLRYSGYGISLNISKVCIRGVQINSWESGKMLVENTVPLADKQQLNAMIICFGTWYHGTLEPFNDILLFFVHPIGSILALV
jgi:hypothetical protein